MNITDALASWEVQPFRYGQSDCCAFVNHVVKKMTGESYLPEYDSDDYMKPFGGLSEAVSDAMGSRPTTDLEPGDVALVSVNGVDALGVILNEKKVVVLFANSLPRPISRQFVVHGWKPCRR